jgi:hypothetical protein
MTAFALALHIFGAVVWVGGMFAIYVCRAQLSTNLFAHCQGRILSVAAGRRPSRYRRPARRTGSSRPGVAAVRREAEEDRGGDAGAGWRDEDAPMTASPRSLRN